MRTGVSSVASKTRAPLTLALMLPSIMRSFQYGRCVPGPGPRSATGGTHAEHMPPNGPGGR
eukprot:14158343-Heterocapsa_arctica.AAC.1